MEAIKLLAGVGDSLDGRLVMFDAKSADWRSVRVKKDPGCSVCAERESGTEHVSGDH
jgi:adenylyltransferase/sulfurtransferase